MVLPDPMTEYNQIMFNHYSLSIKIKKGETLGIIGESGSGKSTLAMAILRLQKSEGEIIFENTLLTTLSFFSMKFYI